MALGACAASPNGRMHLTAPSPVSTVYSEVDMQLSLVTEANTNSICVGAECKLDRAFDQSVLRLGTRLAQSAFEIYPDLSKRFSKFEFIIAEKANPGSISSAAGTVVVFRGVQELRLGDEALAFLIAREMGHVISRHHDENSATSILFSVMAAAFMPVANLISGSAALVQTASATAASSAAASAASFVGSRITIESYKLDQLHEADAIAVNLMSMLGWSRNDIAGALITVTRVMGDDTWSNNLRASAEDVFRLVSVPNSIIGMNINSPGNGETVIKVGLAQPLTRLPAGFTVNDPPRIVFDFLNTTNGMDKPVRNFTEGDLRKTNVIQAAGRTRLAINLDRMLPFNTRIEGGNLLITLQGNVANAAMPDDTPRMAEADAVAPRRQ